MYVSPPASCGRPGVGSPVVGAQWCIGPVTCPLRLPGEGSSGRQHPCSIGLLICCCIPPPQLAIQEEGRCRVHTQVITIQISLFFLTNTYFFCVALNNERRFMPKHVTNVYSFQREKNTFFSTKMGYLHLLNYYNYIQ